MKKYLIKVVAISIIAISAFGFTLFANAQEDGCSTETIFWGTSCCTYQTSGENGGVELYTKCCKYRFWIVWSCETSYVGPF